MHTILYSSFSSICKLKMLLLLATTNFNFSTQQKTQIPCICTEYITCSRTRSHIWMQSAVSEEVRVINSTLERAPSSRVTAVRTAPPPGLWLSLLRRFIRAQVWDSLTLQQIDCRTDDISTQHSPLWEQITWV